MGVVGWTTQVLRDGRFVRRVRKSRRLDRDITVLTLDGGYYLVSQMFLYEERFFFGMVHNMPGSMAPNENINVWRESTSQTALRH